MFIYEEKIIEFEPIDSLRSLAVKCAVLHGSPKGTTRRCIISIYCFAPCDTRHSVLHVRPVACSPLMVRFVLSRISQQVFDVSRGLLGAGKPGRVDVRWRRQIVGDFRCANAKYEQIPQSMHLETLTV